MLLGAAAGQVMVALVLALVLAQALVLAALVLAALVLAALVLVLVPAGAGGGCGAADGGRL